MLTYETNGRSALPELRKEIRLIPFVCGAGAQISGTERGPAEIKKHGLQSALGSTWRKVAWQEDPEVLYEQQRAFYKNLPPLGSAERKQFVLENCRHVAEQVELAVKSGAMPVTLGGDHSIAAGSIAGFARAHDAHGRIGVIWIDAHADLHTMETSPSKTYHGMPLASLLGLGDKDFATIGGENPVLKPEHVVYIGLRSTEAEEDQRIKEMGIKAFSMEDIGVDETNDVFQEALDSISKDVDYLILSIDLDAFDPLDAPAVGSPETGGFNREEVLQALALLTQKRLPDMVEVVEFNPDLPGADKTYALLRDILSVTLNIPDPFITSSAT